MPNILKFYIVYALIGESYVRSIRKGKLRENYGGDVWPGMWFPYPPDYQNVKQKTINGTTTIFECDNGKDNIGIDYDPENPQHSYNYLCLSKDKKAFEPNLNREALITEYFVPKAYVPPRKCLNESLDYKSILPTFGPYRPMAPKFGTYRYLPPQRWLHSLAKGAIVLLYHPCASPKEVNLLQNTLRSTVYRHIITPSLQVLYEDRPMALISWGKSLHMSVVDENIVLNFIKENVKHNRIPIDKEPLNAYYDADLIQEAHLLTDELDSNVFDNMFA